MTIAADLGLQRSGHGAVPTGDALSEERVLTRINDLLVTRADTGAWWASIARSVDNLIDVMQEHRTASEGLDGLHGQILEEHPRLAFQVRSIEKDHAELVDDVTQLRSLIAVSIGRPGGVSAVLASATEVVARIRGHQRRARTLVSEAYLRDLGAGE